MKRTWVGLAVLFSVLLCAGCTPPADGGASAENPAIRPDSIPFDQHHGYAVAYLGYQEPTDLDYYVERYLVGDQLPTYYLSSGDYYLIIPRYPGTELALYQNDFDTDEPILLFHDPDCRPFILQCNASDIFADATVRLTCNGESTEFSPYLSLKDGSIIVGENGLDITKQG